MQMNELLFPRGPDHRWLLFLDVRYNTSGLAICVPFGIVVLVDGGGEGVGKEASV